MRRSVSSLALLFVAWWTIALVLTAGSSRADSIEDEYVRQVIEEDQEQYSYDEYHADDETVYKQQQAYADQERQRREAEEQAARDAADRVAAERERRFEAEMDRMNEEQRQKALKQKKMDGKKVKSILRSSERKNLYQVLGLRNLSLRIPPRTVNLGGLCKFTIPGITLLKEASEKDIRKQFRKRAMEVHPDKNRDGRAQEAFVAVEEAATILGDAKLRKEYDQELKRRREEQLALVRTTIAYGWAITKRTVKVVQTLLGPFFLPVVIVLALII